MEARPLRSEALNHSLRDRWHMRGVNLPVNASWLVTTCKYHGARNSETLDPRALTSPGPPQRSAGRTPTSLGARTRQALNFEIKRFEPYLFADSLGLPVLDQ